MVVKRTEPVIVFTVTDDGRLEVRAPFNQKLVRQARRVFNGDWKPGRAVWSYADSPEVEELYLDVYGKPDEVATVGRTTVWLYDADRQEKARKLAELRSQIEDRENQITHMQERICALIGQIHDLKRQLEG